MNPDERELRKALDARSTAPSDEFRSRLGATFRAGRSPSSVMPAVATFAAIALVVATVGLLMYVRAHAPGPAGEASPVRTQSPASSPTESPIPMPNAADLSAPNAQVLWVMIADRLYVSTDGGGSWLRKQLPPLSAAYGPTTISFVDSTHGWALVPGVPATQCEQAGAQLWRTSDGAGSWQLVSVVDEIHPVNNPNGLGLPQCKEVLDFVDAEHGYVAAWDDNHRPTVYRTSDGGVTWLVSTLPDPPDFMTQPGGFTLRIAWIKEIGGISYLLAFGAQDGPVHDRQYLFRSNDGGATWSWVTKLPSSEVVMVSDARLLWIVPGSSQESVNGGQQWHPFTSDYQQAAGVPPQIVFADSSVGYATVRGLIQRTTDGGAHWSAIKTPGVAQSG